MTELKRIEVLSTAKLAAGVMALAGLIAGILYSFGGLIIDALVSGGLITTSETPGLSFGTVLAFGALIGIPIIFAIPGLIVGAIGAFLYNLAARWIGGIRVDLEQ
jgi:hypothetical protein